MNACATYLNNKFKSPNIYPGKNLNMPIWAERIETVRGVESEWEQEWEGKGKEEGEE